MVSAVVVCVSSVVCNTRICNVTHQGTARGGSVVLRPLRATPCCWLHWLKTVTRKLGEVVLHPSPPLRLYVIIYNVLIVSLRLQSVLLHFKLNFYIFSGEHSPALLVITPPYEGRILVLRKLILPSHISV